MSAAELIRHLAQASEAEDAPPGAARRRSPVPLLLRAQEYSEAAEVAAAVVLASSGLTLEDIDATLVCSLIEFGLARGYEAGRVEEFSTFCGTSRRTVAKRLQGLALPTAAHLIGIGACIRIARALEAAGESLGRVDRAADATGYPNGPAMSGYLYGKMGTRPSEVRETSPAAIAARVLVHLGGES